MGHKIPSKKCVDKHVYEIKGFMLKSVGKIIQFIGRCQLLEDILPWKMQGTKNLSRLPVLQSVDYIVHDYFLSMHTWKCIQIYTMYANTEKVVGNGHRKLGQIKTTY